MNEPGFDVDNGVSRRAKIWVKDFCEIFPSNQMASALKTLMMRPLDIADHVLDKKVKFEVNQRLNEEWADAGKLFRDKLDGAYPFVISKQKANTNNVAAFFGPNGALAEFSEYLEESHISVGANARRALEKALKIREDLDMTDDAFQTHFKIEAIQVRSTGIVQGNRNIREIDTIVLTINGEELRDRLTQEDRDFNWSSDDDDFECSLVLENSRHHIEIAKIEFDNTPWSLCELFDEAQIDKLEVGYRVIWPFLSEGVEVEFLLTMREEVEPFFIKGSTFRKFTLPRGAH